MIFQSKYFALEPIASNSLMSLEYEINRHFPSSPSSLKPGRFISRQTVPLLFSG